MDDDDRPTMPGTIDAAASGREDVHDRDTIPAPEPRAQPAASDNTPTPSVPIRLAADDGGAKSAAQNEAPTVRPPPPPPTAARGNAAASRSASADPASSLAPRELSQRPAPLPAGRRRIVGLLISVVLFGAGVIALQRVEREQQARSAAAAADSQSASDATEPSRPPGEPVVAEPSTPATAAPEPAAAEPGAQAPTGPAARGDAEPLALAATAERAGGAPGAGAHRRAARARATQPVPAGELPETPSRESIATALQDLRGAIELCSDGRSGVAELDLTIRGSGMLAHALVGGDFAGTPQGSCIARTLRKARFAPFQKPKFRVLYRLML